MFWNNLCWLPFLILSRISNRSNMVMLSSSPLAFCPVPLSFFINPHPPPPPCIAALGELLPPPPPPPPPPLQVVVPIVLQASLEYPLSLFAVSYAVTLK